MIKTKLNKTPSTSELGQTCLFCDIVQDPTQSERIFEDNMCLAIMDIHPVNEGHLLIIPKKHVTLFSENMQKISLHVASVAYSISRFLKETMQSKGIILLQSNGCGAIDHMHIHVIPRGINDNVDLSWDRTETSRENIAQFARELSEKYGKTLNPASDKH